MSPPVVPDPWGCRCSCFALTLFNKLSVPNLPTWEKPLVSMTEDDDEDAMIDGEYGAPRCFGLQAIVLLPLLLRWAVWCSSSEFRNEAVLVDESVFVVVFDGADMRDVGPNGDRAVAATGCGNGSTKAPAPPTTRLEHSRHV